MLLAMPKDDTLPVNDGVLCVMMVVAMLNTPIIRALAYEEMKKKVGAIEQSGAAPIDVPVYPGEEKADET